MIPVALKTSSSKEMYKRSLCVHLNLSILVSSARQIVEREKVKEPEGCKLPNVPTLEHKAIPVWSGAQFGLQRVNLN